MATKKPKETAELLRTALDAADVEINGLIAEVKLAKQEGIACALRAYADGDPQVFDTMHMSHVYPKLIMATTEFLLGDKNTRSEGVARTKKLFTDVDVILGPPAIDPGRFPADAAELKRQLLKALSLLSMEQVYEILRGTK